MRKALDMGFKMKPLKAKKYFVYVRLKKSAFKFKTVSKEWKRVSFEFPKKSKQFYFTSSKVTQEP